VTTARLGWPAVWLGLVRLSEYRTVRSILRRSTAIGRRVPHGTHRDRACEGRSSRWIGRYFRPLSSCALQTDAAEQLTTCEMRAALIVSQLSAASSPPTYSDSVSCRVRLVDSS
jgi:hypothetical protein